MQQLPGVEQHRNTLREQSAQPPAMAHNDTGVRYIVNNHTYVRLEIESLRCEVRGLWRARARVIFQRDLAKNGRAVGRAELEQARGAVNAADTVVQNTLS